MHYDNTNSPRKKKLVVKSDAPERQTFFGSMHGTYREVLIYSVRIWFTSDHGMRGYIGYIGSMSTIRSWSDHSIQGYIGYIWNMSTISSSCTHKIFCVVFYRQLSCCLFILAIILFVLLQLKVSDYPSDIVKHVLDVWLDLILFLKKNIISFLTDTIKSGKWQQKEKYQYLTCSFVFIAFAGI